MGDIIQDDIVFNRLRCKKIDLNCAKKYFDRKAFQYIEKLNVWTGKNELC